MSKSLGNVLSPQEILDTAARGCTDVLRRWAAASGLATRSAVSEMAFSAHTIAYKKVRMHLFVKFFSRIHQILSTSLVV